MRALDLFAGAGGWDVAATQLGWHVDGVEIMPEARRTRDAAGLVTVAEDVLTVAPAPGEYDVLIASPPCQTFSLAGTGSGRSALDAVLTSVPRFGTPDQPSADELTALTGDPRTALVLEPLRVALLCRPPFIAWEQVPPVLPVWEACAEVLRVAGYSVVTGYLNAEQFGVPQTRKRAFLFARRDGKTATLPTPTHSRYHSRSPEKLDPGVLPWVSMAEALGLSSDDPRLLRNGNRDKSIARCVNSPSGTLFFGARMNAVGWHLSVTNSRPNATRRALDQPASTLAYCAQRPAWTQTRPSTTVVGDPRLGLPGRKSWNSGESQYAKGYVRLTVAEAATLQTFPADFPFQGSQSKQFLQIGNAVPPLLALHVLRQCES